MMIALVPILAAPGSSTTESQSPDYVHPHALEWWRRCSTIGAIAHLIRSLQMPPHGINRLHAAVH